MTGTRSSAAFYANSLDAFLRASDDEVYAPLTSPHGYTLATAKAIWLAQLSAWRLQLPILRAALAEVTSRFAADAAHPAAISSRSWRASRDNSSRGMSGSLTTALEDVAGEQPSSH